MIEGLNEAPSLNNIFASILSSDGSIRIKANEGEPGAIRRDYKTPDGKEGFKWEKVFRSIDGKIVNISFQPSDYGLFLNITFLLKGGQNVTLCMGVENSYSQDFLKKLPNINLEKPVKVVPYSMEKENGKSLKGVTIYQDGHDKENKIKSFFYDAEKKVNINGIPTADPEAQYDKDDWKMFFITVKKFLVKYTEDNIIPKLPKTEFMIQNNVSPEEVIDSTQEINIEEINFGEEPKKETKELTDKEKDDIIKDIIFGKYGISNMTEVKVKCMELLNIAYTSSNKDEIIKKLQELK